MKATKFKQTEIGEIPVDWKVKSLGDVAEVKGRIGWRGYTVSDLRENGPLVLGGTQIVNNKINLSKPTYLSEEKYLESPEIIVNQKDIIITKTGNSIGDVAIINYDIGRATINPNVALLKNKNDVDSKFLYYWLVDEYSQNFLKNGSSASAQPAINQETIKKLLVVFPNIDEQRKIASILASLDEKIELNRKMNKTLEQIEKALFKRWFVDFEFPNEKGKPYKSSGGKMVDSELGKIPEGWEIKSLDTIASFLNGVACQKYPPIDELGLPVIKITELHNGITENSDRASSSIDAEYILEDGDVLFSWSGSLEVELWTGGKGILNQHLFKVASKNYPKWFYYLWVLKYLPFFREIASNKATTMGHIQRRHLTESLVMVPTNEIFEEMDLAMTPLLDKIIANSTEINFLSKIRDSLLPRLMSGRLRVN